MSGIEIIGLVLGTIPLVIAALEGYQKMGRKRDAFTRRSFHIDRMKHILGRQYRLIQSDIRLVLRKSDLDAILDEDEILTSGPMTLRRADVQGAVRQFLGDHHEDYMDVVRECEKILLDILATISNVAEGSWVVKTTLSATMRLNPKLCRNEPDFWKKVKFTMRKDDMDAAIASLDNAVQTLELLRQRSQQLNETEIMSTARSSRRLTSVLYGIRTKALLLYQALLQSWNWSRNCHDSHAVRLFLENSPTLAQQSHRRQKQRFNLAFEGMKSNGTDTYHICGVEIIESDPSAQGIKFKLPQPTNLQSQQFVNDICDVVVQSSAKAGQMCFYLDDDGKLRYDHPSKIACVAPTASPKKTKLVSLRDVLTMPELTLKGRVMITALIAMAVIQLHSTPWCVCLRKESFYLIRDDHGQIDADNPCVVCHFDPHTRPPLGKQKADAELELLNLGIIILELWHNIAFEDFAASVQVPLESNYDSRHKLARKWISSCQNSMLPDVESAAKRCIGCRFDVADADLDDMKFISGVYDGVVKPLWGMAFGQSQP